MGYGKKSCLLLVQLQTGRVAHKYLTAVPDVDFLKPFIKSGKNVDFIALKNPHLNTISRFFKSARLLPVCGLLVVLWKHTQLGDGQQKIKKNAIVF